MQSLLEYMNSKSKMTEKPKIKIVADELETTPKSAYPAKEARPIKDGKQAQVKENTIKKFSEYLDAKGKMIDRPKTEIIPDFKDTEPYSPPKVGETQPTPYRAPGKDPGLPKGESGFADQGPKELVYKPETGDYSTLKNVKHAWPDNGDKTEAFLAATKDLSPNEFAKYIVKEYGDNNVIAVQKTAEVVSCNRKLMETLVHELKRQNALGKILEVLMNHTETYQEITTLLEDEKNGLNRCKNLARALHENYVETVGPPFGNEEDDNEEKDDNTFDPDMDDGGSDDDSEMGDKTDMSDMHDKEGDVPHDDDIPHDDDMGFEDQDDTDHPSMFGKDVPDDGTDTPDIDDSDDDDGMSLDPDSDSDDDDMDSDDDDDDMGDDDEEPDHKSAHANLLGAMSQFGPMRKTMRGY